VFGINKKKASGQAVIEYIVLLSLVLFFFQIISPFFNLVSSLIQNNLILPLQASYQYGRADASGYDQGSVKNHPRIQEGENSFRMFLNPK
jgi:hypothetical protein